MNVHRFLIIVFFVTLLMATYGCWIMGDTYMTRYQTTYHFDDYRYNPMQVACEISAMPGLLVDFLALDRTDIPEKTPDPWQTAWLIAPSSAILWTALAFGVWRLSSFLKARVWTR